MMSGSWLKWNECHSVNFRLPPINPQAGLQTKVVFSVLPKLWSNCDLE